MFRFNKKRMKTFEITNSKLFIPVFKNLIVLLKNGNHKSQAKIIYELIELINKKKTNEFIELLNSVNMWGGSGAVWEVCFEDGDLHKKFQIEIIKLINLMEEFQTPSGRLKRIRNLFKKEIL